MARRTTGHLYKRGGKYWVKYTVNGKTARESLGTGDLQKARAKLAVKLAPVSAGDAVKKARALALGAADLETRLAAAIDGVRPRIPVADAWDAYVAMPSRPQSGKATLLDFEQRWKKFSSWMAETHGDVRQLEEVTPEHVDEFVATLHDLSPNRYNKIIQTCRLVFRILARKLKNAGNPFANVACKPMATRSHRELSAAELQSVCSSATGELRTLFAIGLYTALRMGDAATLRWEEVSFPLNRITRRPMKTSRLGKIVAIPLHPTLRAILEETLAEAQKGYVLPELAALYLRDKSALSKKIQAHFAACKIATQVKHDEKKRRTCEVGFHSLRHSFVTICASAGVPLAVVQALCGHGSPAIQAKYIHVGVEAAELAVNAMPHIADAATFAAGQADMRKLRLRILKFMRKAPLEVLQKMDALTREKAGGVPRPALPAAPALPRA